MLQDFVVCVLGGQNTKAIDNLEYAIIMMSDYKSKYKDELRMPMRTRSNWFPLVLLHKYRQMASNMNSAEQSQIRVFFRECRKDSKYFSFYLTKYERVGNSLRIHYKAREPMTNEISTIAKIYGLEHIA